MTSSRALSLLAHGASVVFLASEVVAWVAGWWPATPLTFTVALGVVAIGPLVGMLHVATAQEEPPPAAAPPRPGPVAPRRAGPPVVVPPRLAAARRFHAWREEAPVASRR